MKEVNQTTEGERAVLDGVWDVGIRKMRSVLRVALGSALAPGALGSKVATNLAGRSVDRYVINAVGCLRQFPAGSKDRTMTPTWGSLEGDAHGKWGSG